MTRKMAMPSRVSTLALAVALVAGPSPAMAQSFQGDGTFAHGTGSINTPDSVTTNITVTSSQAVIDWTPFEDGGASGQQIVFQAGLTTATFSSATDFAVLNRINPGDMTRMIRMDGTINSLVDGATGGSVYFYSPSGFILGATSVINVGSLVLTSLPITVDANGNFINNGVVTFGAAPDPFGTPVNPAAEIETHPLTQISALNEGSYVAMVAPRVQHHGTINVNGAAALVGAEAATITFRTSGLFDIQVDVGTTDANGVAVYGDITGPASSGSGDNHRAYLVAVPKNSALTMLVQQGADLGFDVAQAADVVGNTVVLSAGHDVFFGSAEFDESTASGAAANVNILNANFTSAFTGMSSGNMDVAAAFSGTTRFFSNASLRSSAGNVRLLASDANSILDIDGNLSVITDRFGQSNGQSVTAGALDITAQVGGSLNVDGNINISANGYGGDSFTTGINAGNGTGGVVDIEALSGGSLTIGGDVFGTSDGYGGQPGTAGVNAGNGTGGNFEFSTSGNGSTLSIAGVTHAQANGYGGHGDGPSNECFGCNGLGGVGDGGFVFVTKGLGTGSTMFFGNDVSLFAEGEGGRSALAGSPSALGTGGDVSVSASGDSPVEGFGLHFAGDLNASAIGRGGESSTPGIAAGVGDGGTIFVNTNANASIGIAGNLNADASGHGGYNDFDVDGGDGIGGFIGVTPQGGNSSINVTGNAVLRADGEASVDNSDCTACGGAGGDGTGGSVNIYGTGFTTGDFVSIGGSLDMSAEGWGGIGVTGDAGQGQGGTIQISAEAGFTLNVGLDATLEAEGYGGYAFNGNSAGDGIGGNAWLFGSGGTVDIDGGLTLDATGTGGSTGISAGGIAGNGTGGNAHIYINGGLVDVAGNAFVNAPGWGGDSVGGTGGNGFGGTTSVGLNDGTIHFRGNLFMDGGAIGGDGDIGGNATAQFSPSEDEEQAVAAAMYTGDGGSIVVDGSAILSAQAEGGNGASGNGGNATAGEVDVVAYYGEITLNSLAIGVSAYGGSGGNGGSGGDAVAGNVDVAFGFADAAIDGTITLGSAFILADGFGGAGGAGVGANFGGDGGAGGDGTGGNVLFVGNAAGGTLESGAAIITARGEGGAGGAGGNGIDGTGGNGGAGGQGTGGVIQTGTVSAELAPGSGGSASYTTLSIDTSGFGGAGGNGRTGGGGDGRGGDGGDAFGGTSMFLARGVLVNAANAQLFASATGGGGGLGSVDGNGGDATTGILMVESKDRSNHPDQRGTLNVGTIAGTAIAAGGAGAVNGASTVRGGSYFRVFNGDATIGSFSFTVAGDLYDGTAGPDLVSVRDGAATISGVFSYSTTGELALDADSGSMTADIIVLNAGNFVPDNFNPAPVNPGTYFADSFDITTGQDFYTLANLDSVADFSLTVPGSMTIGNITSDGLIDLVAQGGLIDVGDLTALGPVSGNAATFLTAGDVNGVSMNLFAMSDLTAGDLTATDGDIAISSNSGALQFISADATGSLLANAGGTMNGGNVTAGVDIFAGSGGDMNLTDLSAANDIGLDSGASMILGIVTATTGSVQASAVDSLSFTSISAGTFVTIDPTAIIGGDVTALAGDVTMTGDSIDIGNVSASDNVILTAQAGDLSTLAINAGIDVTLDATGAMTTGNITAFGTVDANGGSLDLDNVSASVVNFSSTVGDVSTGDLVAFSSLTVDSAADFLFGSIIAPVVDLDVPGSIIGGFIDSDTDITAVAGADIDVGDLSAGGITIEGFVEGSVAMTAGGFVNTGSIDAFGSVALDAVGSIDTDDINAADFVDLDGLLEVTAGSIVAGQYIYADSGGDVTLGDLTAGLDVNIENGGNVVFGNANVGTQFDFESDGSVTGGNIVAGATIDGEADGSVTLQNLTAGFDPGDFVDDDTFSIGMQAGGAIGVGDVQGANRVGFATLGNLTVGSIQAGWDVFAYSDGNIVTGAISTGDGDHVYMSGTDAFFAAGGGEDSDFDPVAALAMAPSPTGGSITIGGPVSTGTFRAAAGTGLTTGAITADLINASAGGLASITGIWSAPNVELWSNDVDIGANGGIDGGADGLIRLVSTNATQALIGDGLTGTGYALTNAEFGRLSAGNVQIAARGDASAAIDMLIGGLTVTGPTAGSTIEDPLGALVFATGDLETQLAGGVIRIVGDVTATGFADTNAIEFYAGRFELDAATGSLSIFESGTTLGGELYIEADRIHVASGTILDQLAADPHYAGYENDLDAPAAVQRPEGVVRAGTIAVAPTEAVLIQNTGTKDQRAGFTANVVDLIAPEAAAPGSIELIVNGQLLGEAGTLFGVLVRDAIVLDLDLAPFRANSTINGCLLVGSCVVEPPFPPGFTPTPGIQDEVRLLENDLLPPPEFDNENVIDDNDEATEEGETSPIEPPQPLFDTSGLGDKGDVDDPVSGSGNPALMETTPPTSNQEKQP